MIREISIVTKPDCSGTLADVTSVLAAENINIDDIDATDDHVQGVIVLRVADEKYPQAFSALQQAGFRTTSHAVHVLELEDRAGVLANVAMKLKQDAINVRQMHILSNENGKVRIALSADNMVRVRHILAEYLVADENS